jgi:hypothetical protein
VKNFAWKAASEALSMESNKLHRHILVLGVCCICGREEEDTAHTVSLPSCLESLGVYAEILVAAVRC